MAILVDSSVWIAAASPKNAECLELQRLIRSQELICVALPIQVEVCQGARSEREFLRLWDSFLGFQFLELTESLWRLCAQNFFQCRKKGITVTTIDCLLATLAKEHGVKLWSLDKVFAAIQPILDFDLREQSKR